MEIENRGGLDDVLDRLAVDENLVRRAGNGSTIDAQP